MMLMNLALFTALSTRILCAHAFAQPAEVTIGTSTALTGPAAGLGLGMRAGMEAALSAHNTANPKTVTIRLLSLDDGYEPARTAPNMRQLIEQDRVVAIVGNVGTPTAVSALPIAVETGTLFIGAFTGAGILRQTPAEHVVINFRASYAQEISAMIDGLIDHAGIKPTEVALFTQRDAFGDSGYQGALKALHHRGLSPAATVPHGRYDRNTTAVENGLADILDSSVEPRAIIMVGTAPPCAAFVKAARGIGYKGKFLAVSFIGAGTFAAEAGEAGDNVIITQVVPHPQSDLPLAAEFRDAAQKAGFAPDFVAFEGFVVGRIVSLGVRNTTGSVTPDRLIDGLEALGTFDIGLGQALTFSAADHQACDQVWPTIVRRGEVVPFEWKELAETTAAAEME